MTFDFSETILEKLITHHIGNRLRDEELILSHELSNYNIDTSEYIQKYFLSSFKPEDFYNFSHSVELGMNEVYTLAQKIFDDDAVFTEESKNIAKLLFEHTNHPNIKEGELNIAFFEEILYEDVILNAIGLFKSENSVPFLQMDFKEKNFAINHDFGFELNKIDKACLIFNIDKESGYRVLIIDNTNKQSDAQYWLNDFLQLMPCNDSYNNTKEILSTTKKFVTKHIDDEYNLKKTDKIDLLNKTITYFKENDSFNQAEFEQEVFEDPNLIKSYQEFDHNHKEEFEIERKDSFEISNQAVKKQNRIYKSVLKLDKNFHVYIHGGKDLIEKGRDHDGRKYYKIYYEEEK